MKIRRLFTGGLFAMAAVATASAQEAVPQFPITLEEMMVSANGADFIDPASIERDGDIVTVRVLAITPREVTATAYFWGLERIDCSARTIEKLQEVHFTESYVEFHRRTAEPVAVPEYAQANTRIDRVCGVTEPGEAKSYAHISDVLFPTWPRIDAIYAESQVTLPRELRTLPRGELQLLPEVPGYKAAFLDIERSIQVDGLWDIGVYFILPQPETFPPDRSGPGGEALHGIEREQYDCEAGAYRNQGFVLLNERGDLVLEAPFDPDAELTPVESGSPQEARLQLCNGGGAIDRVIAIGAIAARELANGL